jgi:hypothetical protein
MLGVLQMLQMLQTQVATMMTTMQIQQQQHMQQLAQMSQMQFMQPIQPPMQHAPAPTALDAELVQVVNETLKEQHSKLLFEKTKNIWQEGGSCSSSSAKSSGSSRCDEQHLQEVLRMLQSDPELRNTE